MNEFSLRNRRGVRCPPGRLPGDEIEFAIRDQWTSFFQEKRVGRGPGGCTTFLHFMRAGKVAYRMGEEPQRGTKAKESATGFTRQERAAMKDLIRERSVVWGRNRDDDDRVVRAKIDQMPEPDRSMGKRIHELIGTRAPVLAPRLWYGMPAYTKEGDVVCFYQPASKFKARYGTLGFTDHAKLDEGKFWPTAFALTGLTATTEATIARLLKRAVG